MIRPYVDLTTAELELQFYEWLEKNGYEYHHSATMPYYCPPSPNIVLKYNGRFGYGFIVLHHLKGSRRYSSGDYFIKK